jgi:hypothetical protein
MYLYHILFVSMNIYGIDCQKKSFIILLSKTSGVTSPDQFRPISLQNCCVKLGSKCLTNSLQPIIPSIISRDQTGFIKGRSVVENFIYAADIVQSWESPLNRSKT